MSQRLYDLAACRDMPLGRFFPTRGLRGPARDQVVEICGRCPVVADCRAEQDLIPVTYRWGVWGGVLWRGGKNAPIDLLADSQQSAAAS